MIARKVPFYTLFALVVAVAGTFAVPQQEQAFVEDIISNDEFYANDDWGTMEVVGASTTKFFEDDDNQLEYGPHDDVTVHGFSTETEPVDDYLPNGDRPPLQPTPSQKTENEVDPIDWDMTVDRNENEIGVYGQAFVETEQEPEALDSPTNRVKGQEITDSTTPAKENSVRTISDKELAYQDEEGLDGIEHEAIDDDMFDDDHLFESDLSDDIDDELDGVAVDDLEGIEEVYSDMDTESVLTGKDPLDGIEVQGQAILTKEDEIEDNYLLEIEGIQNTGPQPPGSAVADEIFVTGQSVKVSDHEDDTHFDDDEDSENTEDLFVDATDRHEKAKIDKLLEDSVAALEL